MNINITIPNDMLWQEASAEDYDVDATENAFELELTRALTQAGYEVEKISWDNSVSVEFLNEDMEPITDSVTYSELKTILDGVDVEYVELVDDQFED